MHTTGISRAAVQTPVLHRDCNNARKMNPCRSNVTCAASDNDSQVASTSRRDALVTLLSIPLLAVASPLSPPAFAASGPRQPIPAETKAIQAAFSSTLPKAKAPVVLRLVFHDAATFSTSPGDGGINASVRFEFDRPENFGLKRGFGVIEATAAKLKGTVAEGVSRADLIALAGAHAVRITGGRVDAEVADPEGRLPAETLSAAEQLTLFAAKGINSEEMVALLGSHTLGSKGYGDPLTFDNTYYVSLLKKPWENKKDEMASMVGIPTDHVLPDDPTCHPIIERYAADQAAFFNDFAQAYLKLTSLGARWA